MSRLHAVGVVYVVPPFGWIVAEVAQNVEVLVTATAGESGDTGEVADG